MRKQMPFFAKTNNLRQKFVAAANEGVGESLPGRIGGFGELWRRASIVLLQQVGWSSAMFPLIRFPVSSNCFLCIFYSRSLYLLFPFPVLKSRSALTLRKVPKVRTGTCKTFQKVRTLGKLYALVRGCTLWNAVRHA